ncbi:hypothetical protein [uncultured Mediterranean phage]|nr:hypothetical protein [uncultured Mediterranean phage]
MIQAYLDSIQERAAEIAVEFTNGYLDAQLSGKGNTEELANDSMRVTYLYGVLENVRIESLTHAYIGGTEVTDAYVQSTRDKLEHYSGYFLNTDLSDYAEVTPDDGDSGSCDPDTPTTNDHRVGSIAVTAGTNIVTFMEDGSPSPLPSTDYTVVMWAELSDGSIQRNLVVSMYTTGGFVVTDILSSGILYYQAVMNT